MILVGIPYHPAKRYALEHLMDWIELQTYQDAEIVMRADYGHYGRSGALKEQFEFFRNLALDRQASHLYLLEADTIPPLNVLERLLDHDKPIVGALYRYRSEHGPVVAWPKDKISSGLCEVEGMGTGALLLARKVLTEFSFYDWAAQDCDYPLFDNLKKKGYTAWLDTDTICKHYIDKENYS